MCNYNKPLQIMPATTQYLNDNAINNYPLCKTDDDKFINDSVIHTSYITRPWGGLLDENRFNKFKYLMTKYVKLCYQLKYKRLLVHLPSTTSELNNLSEGMNVLIKMFNKVPNVILVLEIPSFKSGFKCDVVDYLFNVVINYFDKFVNHNVELCIDTAHMFANGVDCKEMINILETTRNNIKLIDCCKIIHLNGNLNPQYKSDIHCPIFDKRNKMSNINLLMEYLSNKNKILIAENTKQHADYNEWKQFADQYNINIVEYNEHGQY